MAAMFVRHSGALQRTLPDLLRGQIGICHKLSTESDSPLYKTEETLARNHTLNNVGQYFTVDPKIVEIFGDELTTRTKERKQHYFGPNNWMDRNKLFGETNIMIRKPALEIINYIKNADLSQPVNRYVLYGQKGVGKSLTLSHLLCYGHQEGFVVLNFGWIKRWLNRYDDVQASIYKPGRIDHVVNSSIILKHFKQANSDRLSQCVTHRDYSWSARDNIKAGSPLTDVINLGCDRLAFAADALNVVLRELKLNCNEGNLRLMVVCDGVNSLCTEYTLVHREKTRFEAGPYKPWRPYRPTKDLLNKRAKVDDCSVLFNIKKMFKNDYKNAVVVTTVDRTAIVEKMDPHNKWWRTQNEEMKPDTRSHLPFALLGEFGVKTMNPFIPVGVEKYSETEMDSAIDYSLEKGWMRAEAGQEPTRRELHFLSARNPRDFFHFSIMF